MPSPNEKSEPSGAKDIENQIFEAIGNKEFDKVKGLVHANPKFNLNFVDKDELSPLQHACHVGDVDFTSFLLDNGADVNYTNRKDGYTPLMFAAISSKDEIVKLLLGRGVDVTVQNCVNRTAAQMAAFVGLNRITGTINSWVSYEDTIEPFTKCRELEDKPRLHSKALGRTLHKYVVINNNFPIRLFLHLKENLDLIRYGDECIYVLENLSSKASKLGREKESFKYYYLQYCIDYLLKMYRKRDYHISSTEEDQPDSGEFEPELCAKYIEMVVHQFLVLNQYPHKNPDLERWMIKCFMKFPYTHLPFYTNMIMILKEIQFETCFVSLVLQLFEGVRAQVPESCAVCRDTGKNKKCSKCKSVYYCGTVCQNLEWFKHKKICRRPKE